MNVTGNNDAYNAFKSKLESAGVKTTNVNMAKEADFGDYGAALSPELKNEILNSFDNEQDLALQKKIAGLYTNRSVIQSGDFQKLCKDMGCNVKVEYQKTSYISDYKAGNFGNSVGVGSIAVYTISDGMGGEIKIADANGNGALESEELFMNEILGDINNDLSGITPIEVSGASESKQSDGAVSTASIMPQFTQTESENSESQQKDFNKLVEKYMADYGKAVAVRKARVSLGVELYYTGKMDDPTLAEKSKDEETAKVAQVQTQQPQKEEKEEKEAVMA